MQETKRYSDLLQIDNFMDRYRYLKIGGDVGKSTFGFDRYLNQKFYTSEEWKRFRREVIIRDCGCDLAFNDGTHDIRGRIIIHHINPIKPKDIVMHNVDILLDLENVVCVSNRTHEAIHYGDEGLIQDYICRKPNDTKLW